MEGDDDLAAIQYHLDAVETHLEHATHVLGQLTISDPELTLVADYWAQLDRIAKRGRAGVDKMGPLPRLQEMLAEYLIAAGREIRLDETHVLLLGRTARKAWDSDRLARDVVVTLLAAHGLVDDDGIVDSAGVVAKDILDDWREIFRAGGNEARLTSLRAWGLDPDEYCERSWVHGISIMETT